MSQDQSNLNKSYLVLSFKFVLRILLCLSIYDLCRRFIWKHHELLPFWFAELYVTMWAILLIFGLFLIPKESLLFAALVVFAVYRLIDVLLGISRLIFIEKLHRYDNIGYFLLVRDADRWILILFINIFEIISGFAILYFCWGADFCEPITSPLTALYQSILTITTLGYGEIHANGQISQLLVICQLFYFIFYFLLVAPMVFSRIRTKEITHEILGKTDKPDK